MSGKHQPTTIRDALHAAAIRLKPKKITCAADKDLGRLEAEILLAHVLKKDRVWLLAHDDDHLSSIVYRLFISFVARRLKHEPIAYILGEKEFYGLPFFINRHTLIPRPESEMLVELVLRDPLVFPLGKGEAARSIPLLTKEGLGEVSVWDVGTGSGAIAIAIAKQIAPRRVLATDISTTALTTATKNAKRNQVRNIQFKKASLLDPVVRTVLDAAKPSRLVITANLPYLPTGDKKTMDRDVVKFEPSSALFSGRDGLALIEKFLRQLAAFDIHFDTLLLEHDPRQTKTIHALAKKLFSFVMVKTFKDLAGHNRVTEITRS